ncbi:endonuclease domain-containing protein [Sphingomonas sp.]|uniref:endonuclease domain-containing protein n=1 Tax=Sphingomonas sp. TaxID=28214 RepID=UPI002ED85E2A
MPKTDETLLKRAKVMRAEMTQPERELWMALRGKRFERVKFARQVVIGPYIVDFVARQRKLILEVDGDTHGCSAEYDTRRTAWLESQGYRVVRFNNSDVIANMEGVLLTLKELLTTTPLPTLSPKGRGL